MNSPGSRCLEQIRSAVNAYQSRLISFAARITGDADTARDVVQETFLRLCNQDVDAIGDHLPAWLFRVCRNRALDVRKKEASLRPLEAAVVSPPETGADPHRVLERNDEARRVLAAVAGLPATQQEVLRLRFQNDLSYKEISEITSQSVSNVGFLIHVAIKRLRETLQETGGAPSRRGAGGRSDA
jgi:RNA polymerase sigma-70 factor (ECF subfamily)